MEEQIVKGDCQGGVLEMALQFGQNNDRNYGCLLALVSAPVLALQIGRTSDSSEMLGGDSSDSMGSVRLAHSRPTGPLT
jgi:hypothetical protein